VAFSLILPYHQVPWPPSFDPPVAASPTDCSALARAPYAPLLIRDAATLYPPPMLSADGLVALDDVFCGFLQFFLFLFIFCLYIYILPFIFSMFVLVLSLVFGSH
jgi:hypothetical protein